MRSDTLIRVSVFAAISLLILRMFMEIALKTYVSRKKYKYYKESTKFFDRWFFVSARYIVRDKYSKFERRIIRYTLSMKIIFVLNIILNGSFALEIIVLSATALGLIDGQIADVSTTAFFIMILVLVWALGIIDYCENRRYHQMREKRK